jgi:hypothetical protein
MRRWLGLFGGHRRQLANPGEQRRVQVCVPGEGARAGPEIIEKTILGLQLPHLLQACRAAFHVLFKVGCLVGGQQSQQEPFEVAAVRARGFSAHDPSCLGLPARRCCQLLPKLRSRQTKPVAQKEKKDDGAAPRRRTVILFMEE